VSVATAIETPGWKVVTPAAAIWAPLGGAGGGMRRLIEVSQHWRAQGTTAATTPADVGAAEDDGGDDVPWSGIDAAGRTEEAEA
jgi:hypothetical protein